MIAFHKTLLLYTLVHFAFSSVAVNAQESPTGERVALLVKQLGDNSYTARKEATKQLERIGNAGRSHLQSAAESADLEIALRANKLLKRLAANALWSGSVVESSAETMKLSEFFLDVEKQTGNRFLLANSLSNYKDQTLVFEKTPNDYWRSLDNACRLSGHSYRSHYNPRITGLLISTDPLDAGPVAYSGALRGQLNTAKRTFAERLDYRTGENLVEQTFQINLNVIWENRLQLIAYQNHPTVILAETASGKKLKMQNQTTPTWNIAGDNLRQLTTTLQLTPPLMQEKKLSKLVLHWPMIAVGEFANLTLQSPEKGSTIAQDDLTMMVESIEIDPESECNIKLRIARDLLTPNPEEVLLNENKIELIDEKGNVLKTQKLETAVINGVAHLEYSFQLSDSNSTLSIVRLRYPKVRNARVIEFTFKDVALPTAIPE